MVSMLPSSVVYHGFEHRSDKTKDYEIGICCFSAKHTVLRNRDNVSVWGDMFIHGLCELAL
jgi:hypothetical protein